MFCNIFVSYRHDNGHNSYDEQDPNIFPQIYRSNNLFCLLALDCILRNNDCIKLDQKVLYSSEHRKPLNLILFEFYVLSQNRIIPRNFSLYYSYLPAANSMRSVSTIIVFIFLKTDKSAVYQYNNNFVYLQVTR